MWLETAVTVKSTKPMWGEGKYLDCWEWQTLIYASWDLVQAHFTMPNLEARGGWSGIGTCLRVSVSKPEDGAQVIKDALGETLPSSGPAITRATREVIIVSLWKAPGCQDENMEQVSSFCLWLSFVTQTGFLYLYFAIVKMGVVKPLTGHSRNGMRKKKITNSNAS